MVYEESEWQSLIYLKIIKFLAYVSLLYIIRLKNFINKYNKKLLN